MNTKDIISIGCDHAGYAYKEAITAMLKESGYHVQDFGTYSEDSVDYPDFVHPVAASVENREAEMGVLICGSANGVAMTANKHQSIRAAIAWNLETAKLARQHNNANIICLPARFISLENAKTFVRAFIKTGFEGGRHDRRVGKIALE